MKKKILQNGYSIMELLIYIALFAFLSVVLVRSLITVMKTYATAQSYRALQNNGELIMERITREIRNGTTATTSSCLTTPGTLSIVSTDTNNATHTNSFAVLNSKVQLTTDTDSALNISTDEVSVTSLTFCSFNNVSTATPIVTVSKGIKVKLVLSTNRGHIVSVPFYSTVLLRGI